MKLEKEHYIGKNLGGYTINRFIGSGAFAYVYLALSQNNEQVAVKIQYNLAEDARVRFAREAKVLKELPRNECLIRYYADGTTPEGFPYLVMEFVDGITLKDSLRRQPVWSVDECCRFIIRLCDAFNGLHQLGLAHRDVKPENIMLTRKDNGVKLMDLGLVKDAQGLLQLFEMQDVLEGRDFEADLDKGVLAGTPEYMAPEQFSDPSIDDDSQAKTDTWTDVYSIALIFYEMVTGRKLFPFTPDNSSRPAYARSMLDYLQVRTAQDDDMLVPPPGVSMPLWSIIAKALHADPSQRQGTASALAMDLRRYVQTGEGIHEQDSDKTSAIDISMFKGMDFTKPQPVTQTDVAPQPPPRSVAPLAPPQVNVSLNSSASYPGIPVQHNIYSGNYPGINPYTNYPYQYQMPQSNTNLWLLITVIVVVIAILVLLLFLFIY